MRREEEYHQLHTREDQQYHQLHNREEDQDLTPSDGGLLSVSHHHDRKRKHKKRHR